MIAVTLHRLLSTPSPSWLLAPVLVRLVVMNMRRVVIRRVVTLLLDLRRIKRGELIVMIIVVVISSVPPAEPISTVSPARSPIAAVVPVSRLVPVSWGKVGIWDILQEPAGVARMVNWRGLNQLRLNMRQHWDLRRKLCCPNAKLLVALQILKEVIRWRRLCELFFE